MRLVVNIDVPDADLAAAFYESALGLRRGRRLDGDVVELLGAATPLYLLQKEAGSAASDGGARRHYARHWTPVHFDVVIDDLQAAAQRALAAGATQESEAVAWMGSRCISFADPFGHGFCLIQFDDGRGYSAADTPR